MSTGAGVRRGFVVAVVLAGLLVQGCGDEDDGGARAPAGASTSSDAVAKARARVAVLERGISQAPPTSGPKAKAGVKLWIISCGEIAESCQIPADANVEAAEALGWSITRFDAKLDPSRAAAGMRQAIADRADVILEIGFDCVLVKGPLAEAKKAGILTYGAGGTDCDDPTLGDGSNPQFGLTDVVPPGTGPAWVTFVTERGADKARYVIDRTDGKAQVINVESADLPGTAAISQGFAKGLAECSACEVVETVKFTGADATNGTITQAVTNALTAHPEANVLHLPSDGLLAYVKPAVTESGRAEQLLVVGDEGFPGSIEDIRQGGVQDAALALDAEWQSWAELDEINRKLSGEEPVYGGWGYTVIDKDTNLPPKGDYQSKVDFRSAYRKVWGG